MIYHAAAAVSSIDHWFSFGDCCLSISESAPSPGVSWSSKQVLFFLHGRFGQGEMWRPLIERLSSHFRCLYLDLPGFGHSFSVRGRGFSLLEQAIILTHVVRRFVSQDHRAVLVGHDVGGAIAQLCALQMPDSMSGMVLINSASITRPPSDFKTGWLCHQARRKLRKLLKNLPQGICSEHRVLLSADWQDRYLRRSMMQAFHAWEYTWPGPFERRNWKEELRRIQHPVLLIWGAADPLSPVEQAEELMRVFPEAYLFERDSCGHWPCLEDTDWVDEKLREYLFRLEAQIPTPKRRNIRWV